MERTGDSVIFQRAERSTRPSSGVIQALDAVRSAPGIVLALRLVDDLVRAARGVAPSDLGALIDAVADDTDQVTGIGAVHALGAVPGSEGQPALLDLLRSRPAHLREHAAWALGSGAVHPDAVDAIVALVAEGGFGAMVGQRSLEGWAPQQPDAIGGALAAAISHERRPFARARLVETLGLVPGRAVDAALLDRAADEAEHPAVRAAAIAALGDRPDVRDGAADGLLTAIASGTDSLAHVARAALHDLAATPTSPRESGGRTVVQLFLHADLDADLTHAGRGDNGGIATLLVQLGDALAAQGGIDRVVTISRGRSSDALTCIDNLRALGHHYASVPVWGTPPSQAQSWRLRVAARRGIRRILRAAGPVDVLHLRMADVGSMAAAEAARELGVPVVFTLAPDPQALLAARETAGTLSRASFGAADQVEHLVLRDRLVRGIADEAAHLVLFPRPDIERDIGALLGVDLTDTSVRAAVVAEGVDFAAIDAARTAVAAARPDTARPRDLADLDALLATLPAARRHLPIAVSVGRLHRVKGMATLVETWATNPDLAASCNLLVIGGDLVDPSDDEAVELERIAQAVPTDDAASRGLLLAGHRRNAAVAMWLAAVRQGRPGLAAPEGVYVSASLKEEFGIAIVEALAAGLIVVAPPGGGPATYVEDGRTGILVDTTSPPALADAIARALELAGDPDAVVLAEQARVGVRDRLGIGTMAQGLERVYAAVADDLNDSRRVRPELQCADR